MLSAMGSRKTEFFILEDLGAWLRLLLHVVQPECEQSLQETAKVRLSEAEVTGSFAAMRHTSPVAEFYARAYANSRHFAAFQAAALKLARSPRFDRTPFSRPRVMTRAFLRAAVRGVRIYSPPNARDAIMSPASRSLIWSVPNVGDEVADFDATPLLDYTPPWR